ncbi:hypothetical protein QQ045_029960 [Rhodiola kirilowii]
MEAYQQSSGSSTPKITEEHPYDELISLISVSSSSSPSGEFSFASTMQPNTPLSTNQLPVDLSPADDIFFYGHLLPLHLFPQLPISARSSTNSLDSFTLPATEFMQNQSLFTEIAEPIRLPKSKSFAFFKRWKRCSEIAKSEETERKKKQRKFRFELSRLVKRYARLVRPILMFSERRRNNSSNQFKPQPISYSGDLSFRGKQEVKGKKGQYYSAPASIRTSPVNSGILLTSAKSVSSPMADSTMEELQSAIQAAIAHCKNSIATDGHCNL